MKGKSDTQKQTHQEWKPEMEMKRKKPLEIWLSAGVPLTRYVAPVRYIGISSMVSGVQNPQTNAKFRSFKF